MDPVPTSPGEGRRARRILAAAAVIYVVLFACEAKGIIHDLIDPPPGPTQSAILLPGIDSKGYYAWLRAPLVEGSFHFDRDFAAYRQEHPGDEAIFAPTVTGHVPNHYPVGCAIAWAPATVAVHLCLRALGDRSPWPADGFSVPYQIAIGLTTLVLGLLTLVLAYRMARRFATPTLAAAATALLCVGTSVVAYGASQVTMSHGPATAAVALLTFLWLRTFGSTRWRRWLGIGALIGVVCLMRWQLATFAIMPAMEALGLAYQAPGMRARFRTAGLLAVAALASLVVFIPQLAVKQIVYGHPLGGLHETAHNWLSPSLWTMLFATDRSLFYWTPIALPGAMGLLILALRNSPLPFGRGVRGEGLLLDCKKITLAPPLPPEEGEVRVFFSYNRNPPNPSPGCRGELQPAPGLIMAGAFVLQAYALGAVFGVNVYLGWSFGFRMLTEACVLLVPGFAYLLSRASPITARRLMTGGGILAAWNLLLLGVFRHCIGGGEGAGPAGLVMLVAQDVQLQPLEGLIMLVLASTLTVTMVRASKATNTQSMEAAPGTRRLEMALRRAIWRLNQSGKDVSR